MAGATASRLDQLIDLQFDEHGIHRENSPQYHFVASNMFRSPARVGLVPDAPNSLHRCWTGRARKITGCGSPTAAICRIGDSGVLPRAGRRLCRPAASYARSDAVNTLNHSCYCFVRRVSACKTTTWSMLAIKAGFDLPGTGTTTNCPTFGPNRAATSWSTRQILLRPQRTARLRTEHRAHNLIEFGGRNSNPHNTHRTGHAVTDCRREAWGTLIVARIQHRPLEVDHERRYHFAPGRWLVIVDEFQAGRAIDFTHWTHLAPGLEVTVDGHSIAARHVAGGQVEIVQWSNVPLRISVEQGQLAPRIQGWVSHKYGQLLPSPALGLSGRARTAVVVAALSLEPQGRLAQALGGALTWTCGDAVVVLQPPATSPRSCSSRRA